MLVSSLIRLLQKKHHKNEAESQVGVVLRRDKTSPAQKVKSISHQRITTLRLFPTLSHWKKERSRQKMSFIRFGGIFLWGSNNKMKKGGKNNEGCWSPEPVCRGYFPHSWTRGGVDNLNFCQDPKIQSIHIFLSPDNKIYPSLPRSWNQQLKYLVLKLKRFSDNSKIAQHKGCLLYTSDAADD